VAFRAAILATERFQILRFTDSFKGRHKDLLDDSDDE